MVRRGFFSFWKEYTYTHTHTPYICMNYMSWMNKIFMKICTEHLIGFYLTRNGMEVLYWMPSLRLVILDASMWYFWKSLVWITIILNEKEEKRANGITKLLSWYSLLSIIASCKCVWKSRWYMTSYIVIDSIYLKLFFFREILRREKYVWHCLNMNWIG